MIKKDNNQILINIKTKKVFELLKIEEYIIGKNLEQ